MKRRQICTPADVKQIIFICVLFYFELEGITKHLMTGPSGNSEFCFPSTSMFPSASPRGTLRVSGKQNSLFPLGPVIKCLVLLFVICIVFFQVYFYSFFVLHVLHVFIAVKCPADLESSIGRPTVIHCRGFIPHPTPLHCFSLSFCWSLCCVGPDGLHGKI